MSVSWPFGDDAGERTAAVYWSGSILTRIVMARAAMTATSPATRTRSTEDEVLMPRYATRTTAPRITRNTIQPSMVTCSVSATRRDAYALVSDMPAGTYSAYAKIIIQPVRKPPVRPSPWLLKVYSEPADGSRRANSAMLLAQHRDATNARMMTSGDANPAYDTTMTSPPTTAPAGATLLAPNAITRADPTAPWASPRAS